MTKSRGGCFGDQVSEGRTPDKNKGKVRKLVIV